MEKTPVSVWFNLSRKLYEATVVGRGRPMRQDATEEERATSKRLIVTGKTRQSALRNLAKALEVKPSQVEEIKTRMVYKGRREHPYTRTVAA